MPVLKARINGQWVEVGSGGVPPGGLMGDGLVKRSDNDSDVIWAGVVPTNRTVKGAGSLTGGGDLTKDVTLHLEGEPEGVYQPVTMHYYGTDAIGVKGFHQLPSAGDNEVHIGPEDPLVADPFNSVELWVDEDAPSATVDEVWIGPDDPSIADPSTELWYDTDSEEPVAAIGIMPWDATITYLPDEKVTHPVGYPDVWSALRKTIGEEPGAAAVVDAIDFNPNSTTLPQGFSAVLAIVNPGPAPSTGLDIRLRVYTSWHPGCMVSATDAMGVSIFYLGQANNGTEDVIRWSVLTDQATQVLRDVPLTAFDPATRPWLRGTADPSNNILRLFDSDDGINWAQCGADFVSPYPLVMPTLASIHIGHDNVSNVNNYIGVLSQVELHDIEGARWTSWIARTQPTTGAGISPQTGEDYLNINTCPVTGATGTDIPWKNISNVVHWSPDSTNGMGLEGQGVTFYGGARIYKKTGAGLVIRKHSGNTHPVVENYDGSNVTNIITANGAASMTAPLGSGTALGPKFYTYGTTFGIGVDGGTFVTFFPAGNKAAFRTGTYNGTEVASINASGALAIGSITTTGDVTIGGAIKAVDSISSLGFVVISGSDPTNSSHFYVDSKDNAEDVTYTVLEGRRLDLKSCFKLKGRQGILEGGNVRGRLECWVTGGDDGEKLIWMSEQDTGGQPELGNPNGMTYAVDLWESSALVKKTNVNPLDPDKASHLIDAIKPITFDRPGVRGIGATRDPLPLHRIGIAVEDIEGSEVHVERLIRGKGDDRGYSLGGMLSVAISEIKSLRTRMAQMEDELKELRGTKGPDTGGPSTSKPPKPKPRGR